MPCTKCDEPIFKGTARYCESCVEDMEVAIEEGSIAVVPDAVMYPLRRICGKYGDNHWDERSGIIDVLENHLEPYLNGTKKRK